MQNGPLQNSVVYLSTCLSIPRCFLNVNYAVLILYFIVQKYVIWQSIDIKISPFNTGCKEILDILH